MPGVADVAAVGVPAGEREAETVASYRSRPAPGVTLAELRKG